MEYTQDERLAVLTAMQKQIKPALDEAKAIARQEIMEGFAETHTDRRAIIVGDEKVGEIGVSVNLFFTSFAKQARRSRKGGFTGCANVFSPIPVTA